MHLKREVTEKPDEGEICRDHVDSSFTEHSTRTRGGLGKRSYIIAGVPTRKPGRDGVVRYGPPRLVWPASIVDDSHDNRGGISELFLLG
jgi:hypothetical protein